jgi:UDP-2,3-diacylglucosamine hydrolase
VSGPDRSGNLVFVGDVHLEQDDPCLDAFLRFLDGLEPTSRCIVFLGDLFNLWIGRPELEQPHQTAVVQRLTGLRRRGVRVRYVEGNRDYRLGPCYAGRALDDASDRAMTEHFAGRTIVAVHGDMANPADRRYRRWRRISRSRLVWTIFNLLPRSVRLRLAHSLERRLRASNREFKVRFPEEAVRDYAEAVLGGSGDALVLGHFHVEKELPPAPGGPPGRVFVLPEWKSSRRHLRVEETGEIGFVDSDC